MQDIDLEGLFTQARAAGPTPSAGLITRIEADAVTEHHRRRVRTEARPTVRRSWADWIGTMGGSALLAGLGTATLVGVWLGFAQPEPVSVFTETVSGAFAADTEPDQVDLLPTLETFALEG